jgi:hypothetical protein
MSEGNVRANTRFLNRGLKLPQKPEIDIPSLPLDITEIDDEELMNLFVTFTSWSDYLGGQTAMAVIDEREADRLVAVAEAKSIVSSWTGKSSDRVSIAKAQRMSDPTVVALQEQLDEHYAYRKLVEVLSTNVERDSSVISRELTRRTAGDNYRTRSRKYGA